MYIKYNDLKGVWIYIQKIDTKKQKVMKLLIVIFCMISIETTSYGQNGNFSIGPAIGVDQFLSKPQPINDPNVNKNTAIIYKPGLLYGIECSYLFNKALINTRILTTKRTYDATSTYNNNPQLPIRVSVIGRYYSFPTTFSYLIKSINKVQVFFGAGIVPEFIDGSFDRLSYDIFGSGRVLQLDPEEPAKKFSMGGSLQVIGRYSVNKSILVQIQPALHYFSKIETPFATTNNSSFSLSISANYYLNR